MKWLEKYYRYFVILLLIILLMLEVSTAVQESQTVDEGVHLAAGYSYLIKHDFRMNPEHPPLLKEIAALPLFIINKQLRSPFDEPSWSQPDEWQFARDFIYNNKIPADTILLLGRLPIMLLSLLLGYIIFKWSRELFGITAGLFSLLLYVFSPDIIAHSRYVTTDIGVTLFFLLTIYYFYKYLKSPRLGYLIVTGVFFGIAQASKFSAVLLIPTLPLLYLLYYFYIRHRGQDTRKHTWKQIVTSCLIIFLIGSIIVWATYFFEIKKPIQDVRVQLTYTKQQEIIQNNTISDLPSLGQKIIHLTDPNTKSGKWIQNLFNTTPVPAYSYFRGFIQLYGHNYHGHMGYLLGHYTNFGWWYYFPFAFLVKEPVSLLVFIIGLCAYVTWKFIKNKRYRLLPFRLWREISFSRYILIIPATLYLLWSLTSHLNLGIRHILIIFPFIFIGLGYLTTLRCRKQQYCTISICLLLGFYIASSSLIYPHYLAYFNEIVGGPNSGPKYLVDSNIDWGQDVKKLKKYMVESNIDHVCLSYFGQAKLEYYKIDYWYLPDNANFHGPEALNCVVAISATSLLSQAREYGWLLNYTPTTKIGYSIYIYEFRNKE